MSSNDSRENNAAPSSGLLSATSTSAMPPGNAELSADDVETPVQTASGSIPSAEGPEGGEAEAAGGGRGAQLPSAGESEVRDLISTRSVSATSTVASEDSATVGGGLTAASEVQSAEAAPSAPIGPLNGQVGSSGGRLEPDGEVGGRSTMASRGQLRGFAMSVPPTWRMDRRVEEIEAHIHGGTGSNSIGDIRFEQLPVRAQIWWGSLGPGAKLEAMSRFTAGQQPPLPGLSRQEEELLKVTIQQPRPLATWANPGVPGVQAVAVEALAAARVFPGSRGSGSDEQDRDTKAMRFAARQHFEAHSHWEPLTIVAGREEDHGQQLLPSGMRGLESRVERLRSYWPKVFVTKFNTSWQQVELEMRTAQLMAASESPQVGAAATWASAVTSEEEESLQVVKRGVRELLSNRSAVMAVAAARVQATNELWFTEALDLLHEGVLRDVDDRCDWFGEPPAEQEVLQLFRGPRGAVLGVPGVGDRVRQWVARVSAQLSARGRMISSGLNVVAPAKRDVSQRFWAEQKNHADPPVFREPRPANGAGGVVGAAGARGGRGGRGRRGAAAAKWS